MWVLAVLIDKLFFIALFCGGIHTQRMSNCISECHFITSMHIQEEIIKRLLLSLWIVNGANTIKCALNNMQNCLRDIKIFLKSPF